jgi:hypothetical protein
VNMTERQNKRRRPAVSLVPKNELQIIKYSSGR